MNDDIRDALKTVDRVRLEPRITDETLRRAKGRRIRSLLAVGSSGLALIAAVVVATNALVGPPDSRLGPAGGGWVAIADLQTLQQEKVVYDERHRVFAVWNEGDPIVLSAFVPHVDDQERALYCTSNEMFGGPHGETFDRRGVYYAGPASRGLGRVAMRVVDGVVQFDPENVREGPARPDEGSDEALDPTGPFCAEDYVERAPGFAALADGNPALESDFDFEPYPGSQWYGPDGDPIPAESSVINVIRGPDHCDWDSAAMLHVGWPLGHAAADDSESRQFVRDPDQVLPQEPLMSEFDDDAVLYGGARHTGYHTDFMELWLFPEDDTGVFLMFSDHVEWWPRAEESIACA